MGIGVKLRHSGRKSEEELKIAKQVVEIKPRLPAPVTLNSYQTDLWVAVINTKPADWFQADTAKLLESYCKHCYQAMMLDSQMDNFDPEWLLTDEGLDRLKKLTDMREKHTRQITAISRSMRLTQQSQYDTQQASRKNKNSGPANKPWES